MNPRDRFFDFSGPRFGLPSCRACPIPQHRQRPPTLGVEDGHLLKRKTSGELRNIRRHETCAIASTKHEIFERLIPDRYRSGSRSASRCCR